ncbi:MAG: oxygenase MpaB family protein [Phaeodactylibacter xiamenensis]|uniref:oxygenase MpaB family protein n=1 Tax=Phaeodactylibacter xiamenensis TaxID=1524460 RepID=UPI00126A3BDF|nr:oxygenase MpaB family protein [Phaeodactylibacter xiamenensis]MCR9054759.1 DUF2236 domain-containing protein [bacterium]
MPTSTTWNAEFLDQMRQTADPLADQAVAHLVTTEGREAAQRLFDLLIRRIEMPLDELPPSLKDYWEATQQLPDWVDSRRVEAAHGLFRDHGPKFLLFLYYKSLPLLYCCKNGAQVLVQTSRLAHNREDITIFTRRIAETGQFLIDVMTDGGLQPGKTGIQSIQKVRLIHAAIRHFIPPERWDTERLGMPINQEDLAVTLMTFSVAVADGLEQFGIPEPTERLESYLHCWKGIGALLGIDERLLPTDLASARTLLETILKRQAAPSEAGQLLTKALVEFAERTLPAERMDDAPQSLINYLIGRERAQMLGITPPAGCLPAAAPFFLKSLFRAGERLEDKIREPKSVFIDWFSMQMARRMVGYFDTYKQRHFEVPERMRQAWFEGGG